MQNNGSVFAHIFLTRNQGSRIPTSANYNKLDSIYVISREPFLILCLPIELNKYLLSKKVVKKNLWSGEFENPQLVKVSNCDIFLTYQGDGRRTKRYEKRDIILLETKHYSKSCR